MFSKTIAITGWLVALLLVGGARPALAQFSALAQFYQQHNFVSDGAVAADITDPKLVNAWGLVSSDKSPWWVSNNGTASSTLYNTPSATQVTKQALEVAVPGAPTGVVFNGGSGFVVTNGTDSGPAVFIFASEDGSISGWNPAVPPPPPSKQAQIAVPPSSAVYKGLAIATVGGNDFLCATNFHAGTVDVFDSAFMPVHMPGAFVDSTIPQGYAPFGIRNIEGTIYVTYALQDADAHDDVAGMGHGYINAFDQSGHLLRRVASKGTLNSPWGLALAPDGFGRFSGDLLVGNFGDGRMHAYDPAAVRGNGEFQRDGMLHNANGQPLQIDGLWALSFGNGGAAGPTTTLFFTAGPNDESNGLFGSIVSTSPPGQH